MVFGLLMELFGVEWIVFYGGGVAPQAPRLGGSLPRPLQWEVFSLWGIFVLWLIYFHGGNFARWGAAGVCGEKGGRMKLY